MQHQFRSACSEHGGHPAPSLPVAAGNSARSVAASDLPPSPAPSERAVEGGKAVAGAPFLSEAFPACDACEGSGMAPTGEPGDSCQKCRGLGHQRPVVPPTPPEKPREAKDWHCPECKRWMTLRQAQRAMEHGCLKGCSGIDIEHVPGGRR